MSTIAHKHTQKKLPSGWRLVRLDEVATVVNGFGFAESLQGRADFPYPFIKVSDMNAQGSEIVIDKAANTVDAEILKQLGARCYPQGTVIFPKVGGALLTNKKRVLGRESSFDNNIMGVVPKCIDSQFLFFWFCTVDLASHANTQALPSIRQSLVASFLISLPPLAEQQRIAAILKEQMATVAKARAAAEARLVAVKTLPAAFRNQIFPRPDQKLAVSWKRKALGAVLEISSGQVDPKDARYKDLPHVNGENIESGTGRLLNVRSAAEDNMTSGKYLFEPGVVLYSKLRPYLMKVSVAHFRGLCSADMYPLTPHFQEMTLDFLQQLLLSDAFTNYAVAESQRARMPKLNREQLMAYAAPIPPFDDQRRIAAHLREQMDAAETARAAAQSELTAINALPAALLRRAFNGEL